jgi:hypothetical protein
MSPKSLKPCNSHEVMKQQLEIRVQTVLLLAIFTMLFFIICFLFVPQTYGFL